MLPPVAFTRRYVEHMEKRTEAHLGYQMAAALSLLTQTAPPQLAIPHGTDLYANELFLLVGASGRARKSTVVIGARRMLSDSDYGVQGAFPLAAVASDIASSEGVQDLFYRQPRCFFPMEEFGDFLTKTASPQHGQKRTLFNGIFDCAPMGRIRVESKNRSRTENSKNPRGSVLAGCATKYLIEFTRPLDWTGGFMSRWFMFYANDERKLEPGVPDKEEIQLLVKLLQVKERARVTPALFCSGRTPMAEELWKTWTTKTRAVINNQIKSEAAKAVLQRAETHALKIALLFAWDLGEAYLDGWRMSARALAPALRFTNMHIRSVARMVEEIPANEEAAERAMVLSKIEEEPESTNRKALLQSTNISAKRLANHVLTMMQAGDVTIVGSDDGGNVSFSRVPKKIAKSDHYDSLELWSPPAESVVNERGGETAIASLQIETAHAGVVADTAPAIWIE